MRRFVRSIIPMAITAAVTHFLMFLILGDILFTVACALVGQKWAALPYTLFLFLLQVGAILIVWRVRKPRDSEARRGVRGSDLHPSRRGGGLRGYL